MTSDSKGQKQVMKEGKAVSEREKPPRSVGGLWQVLGVLLFIVGTVTFTVNRSTTSGYLPSMVIGTLAWMFMLGGVGLFNHGRKYTAASAREVFAQDKRKPVIYLRSFKDDTLTSQVYSPYVWKTEEEQIAYVMNGIGPFIAIGNPRDELPDLGAARVYLGDNEWQRTVSVLTSHAQLVVLRAGGTPGFWWEVERVSKKVKPERLLFLIPFAKKQYDEFCQRANLYFPKPLPEYTSPSNELLNPLFGVDGSLLRGIVYFEKDWTPRFVPLKGGWNKMNDLSVLSSALRHAIQPVFEQLQIPYASPATPFLTRIAKLILFAVLVFAVLGLSCYISAQLSGGW